ncbi:hypothetical protein GCM10023194_40890 [Planotetraspora phitsanulokensis]|uniref:Uncharacterized protein n=1 Tax=Planotetraspora phitsanulokensis TaxID=575192 RepID=A0A8J3XLP9_9ACTN|nr:hypothetical protein [Planotetraspora phitsanulokensis]GII40923.1 hypothetical protein Pph01_59260 [Planotetraspora phitsanulokensis]
MTSEYDKFEARKAELRKSGKGAVEAHSIAYREASQRLHEREEAWHDQQEQNRT